MSIKTTILNNIKNLYGWKTNRKIVVISVDDYGNVRLDSKQALDNMLKAGLKTQSRFDQFDALENTFDLEMLFEVLSSVKDKNGKHAIFTPFAIPCNIDFEKMSQDNYKTYSYELLPTTFSKLKGYEGTWQLWQEGMKKGLLVPQFHGREHFHLKVFTEKLETKDFELLTSLQNRSLACISNSGYKTISYTAAFEFWNFNENESFKSIITDGLNAFEKVFGFKSTYFNPPGGREHPVLHETLANNGIKYIDTYPVKKEHLGNDQYKTIINYTGKVNNLNQLFLVRNVVFEPTEDNRDWVNYSIQQIEAAFRWRRPAIISSHRANYCGQIDESNRQIGIDKLRLLLKTIVAKWPDVEFMAANELGDLILSQK
jgi:hypothetical protein